MPTAPVDDNGTVLFYEDSGAPAGCPTYLTVVLLHGLAFHGEIFKRLLPHAAPHALRLVRVNLRDYPGSTPLSAAEHAALASGDAAQQGALLRDLGRQVAAFLEHVAKTFDIPPIAEVGGRQEGGMALLAWSMGNTFALSFLAHASTLEEERQDLLSRHLRTLIMLDPVAGSTLGAGVQGAYHPFRDAALSMDARIRRAMVWLSHYFTPVPALDGVTPALLAARTALHDSAPAPNPDSPADAAAAAADAGTAKTPTLLRLAPAERAALQDPAALVRSSLPLLRIAPDVFAANFERALFDTRGALRGVGVLVAWCAESMGDAVWCAKVIAGRVAEREAEGEGEGEGKVRREVRIVRLEGANHFPHWDRPEQVIELLTTHV